MAFTLKSEQNQEYSPVFTTITERCSAGSSQSIKTKEDKSYKCCKGDFPGGAVVKNPPAYWIIFHCLDISQFIHSPTDGHHSCFQALSIMNKVAINICMEVFVSL